MAKTITVELTGLDEVKRMFAEVGHDLKGRQLGGFLQAQGRAIVKVARTKAQYKGEIKRLFKKDLGVSKVKGSIEKPFVTAGPKFVESIDSKNKVAVVAQHFTEGFKQSNRTGEKSGLSSDKRRSRGKVALQVENPMIAGLRGSEQERSKATQQEFKRKVNSIKRKYSRLVK